MHHRRHDLPGNGPLAPIVNEWSGAPRGSSLVRSELLHELFEAQADAPPSQMAVECGGARLTCNELEFHGRAGSQVTLRGFRIELAEIKSILTERPGVKAAIAVMREDRLGMPNSPAASCRTKARSSTGSESVPGCTVAAPDGDRNARAFR